MGRVRHWRPATAGLGKPSFIDMNIAEFVHVHITYQQATALIGCGDDQLSRSKVPLHEENPAVFDGWRRSETLKVAIGIGLPHGASRALHTVLSNGAQVSSCGFYMRLICLR